MGMEDHQLACRMPFSDPVAELFEAFAACVGLIVTHLDFLAAFSFSVSAWAYRPPSINLSSSASCVCHQLQEMLIMLGASGKGDETEKHQEIRRPTRKRLKTSQH